MLNALRNRSIGKRYKFPGKHLVRADIMQKLSNYYKARRGNASRGMSRAIPKFKAAARRAKGRVRSRKVRRNTSVGYHRKRSIIGFKRWVPPTYNKGYAYTYRKKRR